MQQTVLHRSSCNIDTIREQARAQDLTVLMTIHDPNQAFAYADKHGYSSVTVCEKPNVIRETSGMMLDEGRKVQARYPDIQLWDTNIDAQMMWLTKNPEDYGVIVAGNMFGDIVSDGFAGLVGGFASSCPLSFCSSNLLRRSRISLASAADFALRLPAALPAGAALRSPPIGTPFS